MPRDEATNDARQSVVRAGSHSGLIATIARIAHEAGALLSVDSAFASSYNRRFEAGTRRRAGVAWVAERTGMASTYSDTTEKDVSTEKVELYAN
jgi:hypothetical protein